MLVQYYHNLGREVQNDFAIDYFMLSVNRVKPLDYEGESHEFWEVVYVDDGEVEVTEDGNVYVLGKGDIIFHAPMEFHRIRSCGGTIPNVTNLSFGILGDYPKALLSGVFHLNEAVRKEFLKISENVRSWLEEKGEDPFFGQEIATKWISFMLHLSRTYQHQNQKISNERAHSYKRAVEIMNEEVHSNISIEELAKRMFVSTSYIKILFKRYAGVSPKTYYTNLRINEATRMLEEGMSVQEIAERMNFSTPGYFSVCFKKHTGISPRQYRKTI